MTKEREQHVMMEMMAEASSRIVHTQDGLWVADGLSDRIIGYTYGELVDLACKVQSAHARDQLSVEPLDKIGLDAKFFLLNTGVDEAEKSFRKSVENECPSCGCKKEAQ